MGIILRPEAVYYKDEEANDFLLPRIGDFQPQKLWNSTNSL